MQLLLVGGLYVGASAAWLRRGLTVDEKHAGEPVLKLKSWKQDCFKRVPAYGLVQAQSRNPGAGMNPDEIQPFQIALKDGFMNIACVKDAMYEHGDKFGTNKHTYKMGPIGNSSIVHYTDIIPKEDRKQMTPEICFEFCRGIPDMGFFGVSNGRDCYCTPYYKPMASDSSTCDSVCEGDNTQMCGGKTKNSIFSMRMCDTTEDDLHQASQNAVAVESDMEKRCGEMKTSAEFVEHAAQTLQAVFGEVGDPSASNQMQASNVRAGELLPVAQKCIDFAASVRNTVQDADQHSGKDLKSYDNRAAAEDDIAKLTKVAEEGKDMLNEHVEAWQAAQPKQRTAEEDAKHLDQYYSLMYFVDKEHVDVPVTCSGEPVGEPTSARNAGQCAALCDDNVGKCVGFAAYGLDSGEETGVICLLFSKFKTAQYYTGCVADSGPPQKKAPPKKAPPKFLQRQAPVAAMCRAKFSLFGNVSLKPLRDGSGKNKFALKEITKADRCPSANV